MKTNIEIIQDVLDYIEDHLEQSLSLEEIASQIGYSPYHLHKLFTSIAKLPIHTYIVRRRLTEAAHLLVLSETPILDIAQQVGYQSQQAFTTAFKNLFHHSPNVYRQRKHFVLLQDKISIPPQNRNPLINLIQTQQVHKDACLFVGTRLKPGFGFFKMGLIWRTFHAKKQYITNRIHSNFTFAIHDYSTWQLTQDKQPTFDYYACVEVSEVATYPQGMVVKELPASDYLVFTFLGKNQESVQPLADFIYQSWLPQSCYQLNEKANYDLVLYGEKVNFQGISTIEYWIPILNSQST